MLGSTPYTLEIAEICPASLSVKKKHGTKIPKLPPECLQKPTNAALPPHSTLFPAFLWGIGL